MKGASCQVRWTGVLSFTSFQMTMTCILSLSDMAPSMATLSKSSLFKALWSSGRLTSAFTLITKCVYNFRFDAARSFVLTFRWVFPGRQGVWVQIQPDCGE